MFYNSGIQCENLASNINLIPLVALAAVRSVVINLLFVVAPIVCGDSCYVFCFVLQYFVSLVQALISVCALVFNLTQLTCQKRFDCRNAILRSSTTLLGTSYSQIVVAVLLKSVIFELTLR